MKRLGLTTPTIAAVLLIAAFAPGCGSSKTTPPPPAAPVDPQQKALEELGRVLPQAMVLFSGELKPAETSFEEWEYPDSRGLETSKDIESSVTGRGIQRHTQLGFRSAMTTKDDFPTVVRHYGSKMEALAPAGVDEWLPEGRGSQFSKGVSVVYDVNGRTGNHPREGLQQGTFVLQAANCSVHVTINRAPGEDLTYIHVVFHQWPVAEQ